MSTKKTYQPESSFNKVFSLANPASSLDLRELPPIERVGPNARLLPIHATGRHTRKMNERKIILVSLRDWVTRISEVNELVSAPRADAIFHKIDVKV